VSKAMELLKRFCADADDVRYSLQEPWKDANGTVMASNGHVAIILDPGTDVPEVAFVDTPRSAKLIGWASEIPSAGFLPARWDFAPDPECDQCDRKSSEPDEDGFVDSCYWCDGTGFNKKEAIAVGDAHFAKHYLRLIASLPDCQIATAGSGGRAFFRFNGGIGFLLPVRR
jgi:hypothetical protein